MSGIKLVIIAMLLSATFDSNGYKRVACARAKSACVQQEADKPTRCALKPRTRRSCPAPEYGLHCDSCCYQAYRAPSYYANAFRPFYGDGYFGRRPGNFNFTF